MTDVAVPDGVVVRRGDALQAHSPWRVGGPCDAFVVVLRADAVADATAWCRDQGWARTWVGAGSRTVFRDAGIAGAVLRLGGELVGLRADADGWWVGAATPLCLVGALPGVGALSALVKAPGSLGASLALDDGWEAWVDQVRYVSRGGVRTGELAEARSKGAGVVFTEARVRARPSIAKAKAPGAPLPTSWYEDEGEVKHLMRSASLGDVRLRQALIPAAAPELIVNLGGASAKDLALLQRSAMERVHKERGVQLRDRMRWTGRQG